MTATPESALVSMLRANGAVAAVVGARVWPNSRPQGNAYPAITVTRISGAPEYADDGEVGLLPSRIQISCWGLTYSDAKELAVLVTAALSSGHDVVQDGVTFIHILLDNEQDLHEFGANNAEFPHQIVLDFLTMTTRPAD